LKWTKSGSCFSYRSAVWRLHWQIHRPVLRTRSPFCVVVPSSWVSALSIILATVRHYCSSTVVIVHWVSWWVWCFKRGTACVAGVGHQHQHLVKPLRVSGNDNVTLMRYEFEGSMTVFS
jgi:hypothetical protein